MVVQPGSLKGPMTLCPAHNKVSGVFRVAERAQRAERLRSMMLRFKKLGCLSTRKHFATISPSTHPPRPFSRWQRAVRGRGASEALSRGCQPPFSSQRLNVWSSPYHLTRRLGGESKAVPIGARTRFSLTSRHGPLRVSMRLYTTRLRRAVCPVLRLRRTVAVREQSLPPRRDAESREPVESNRLDR